jgi:hypothetical protein
MSEARKRNFAEDFVANKLPVCRIPFILTGYMYTKVQKAAGSAISSDARSVSSAHHGLQCYHFGPEVR